MLAQCLSQGCDSLDDVSCRTSGLFLQMSALGKLPSLQKIANREFNTMNILTPGLSLAASIRQQDYQDNYITTGYFGSLDCQHIRQEGGVDVDRCTDLKGIHKRSMPSQTKSKNEARCSRWAPGTRRGSRTRSLLTSELKQTSERRNNKYTA